MPIFKKILDIRENIPDRCLLSRRARTTTRGETSTYIRAGVDLHGSMTV